MAISSTSNGTARSKTSSASFGAAISPEHYLRLILHRKWMVLGAFVIITGATVAVTSRLPDIYASSTLILVDPQKVPESYVKSTVTGDIQNRLGTLSQQILSATRLQTIIDNLNLYPAEKKKGVAREDLISKMRSDISVQVESSFGGSQDLQAFRVGFSGQDPKLVAQVANELAQLFIDENLKARDQQAADTTEFLRNQLQQARKHLEDQEGQLRDFRMKHLGEMPEQQAADLQILGQLQSQLQLAGEALNRAEQQKTYAQSLMNSPQPPGVVERDDRSVQPPATATKESRAATKQGPTATPKEKQLAALLARGYKDDHPDVRKLRKEIEAEKANNPPKDLQSEPAEVLPAAPVVPVPPPATESAVVTPKSVNPVLVTQLNAAEADIAKYKQQIQSLNKQVAVYQQKLETIPVNEQQIAALVRDYDISKAHYSQLLNNEMSAETATQLELRQKAEKFQVLDPAQPAEKPSRPNRRILYAGGGLAGLAVGLLLALATEFLGMCITSPDQITVISGLPVLEVIPNIQTRADRLIRKRRIFLAALSGVAAALVVAAIILYNYRTRFF